MERLAWELASADPPTVPILINLREYDGQPLLEWIRLKLVASNEPSIRDRLNSVEDTKRFLREMPFTFYILLDGLNEVRPAYHETILQEILRLSLEFPNYPIVVTSRVQDEKWRELRTGSFNAETLVVQTIKEHQAQSYLVAHLNKAEAHDLWQRLDARMRGLTATPLLLWLVKEAWKETKGRIPGNRGELYASFVERMLRRDDDRKLNNSVSKEQRLAALQELALAMHEQQVVSFSRGQVRKIIPDEQVLDALLVNGLLQGEDELRFAPHQTIQEYFAARAIQQAVENEVNKPPQQPRKWWQKLLLSEEPPLPTVLNYASDSWWAETFIQLAGITTSDPNLLAQRIAEYNPWLAWWCVQEGQKVDAKTEQVIQAQSALLVESANVQDRRNAVQSLVKLPPARVVEPLAKLAVDADSSVSGPAQLALSDLSEVGQKAIQQAFDAYLKTLATPSECAEYGRAIVDHDPRKGVGVILLNGIKIPDIDWVNIPAGEFSYQDGKKMLGYDFQISRYPITYAQFQAFLDDPEGYDDPQNHWFEGLAADDDDKQMWEQEFKYANHPSESVNWYQAIAFCRWLSWRMGGSYNLDAVDEWTVRLPTEFEWEKAARANTGWQYPYGNDFDATKGNTRETGIGQTSAVGIFSAGDAPHWEKPIADLSGNVWEWCLTDYNNPAEEILDENISSKSVRVLRGGSFDYGSRIARAAVRYSNIPTNRHYGSGFRLFRRPPSRSDS